MDSDLMLDGGSALGWLGAVLVGLYGARGAFGPLFEPLAEADFTVVLGP